MPGSIDPDDQSESTVTPGLHACDGVLDDNGSRRIDLQSPGRFEKTIWSRLACKMEPFAFDTVNPSLEAVREAGFLQHGCGVLAG